ncbi:hypothetical protein H0H92_007650, partial [Tricholoma furcatifolium]
PQYQPLPQPQAQFIPQPQPGLPNAGDLMSYIQSLENMVKETTETVMQLQQQPRYAPSAPCPLPIPPTQTVQEGKKLPKFALPLKYSEEMNEALSFANSCKLYMDGHPEYFTNERVAISWVLFMQEGLAAEWRDNFIDEMKEGGATFYSLKEFWKLFPSDFGDPDIQSTKILKLRVINQGSKTMDQHVQDFKNAARGSGYTGVPLVEEFKRSTNN